MFEAWELDRHGWVIDFGSLKQIKAMLVRTYDHRTVICWDDPELSRFRELQKAGVCDLTVMDAVGCEAFAAQVFKFIDLWLDAAGQKPRVRCVSVECREHGANSAVFVAGGR